MSHYSKFREKAQDDSLPSWEDHLTHETFFKEMEMEYDNVNKPRHYNSYPGVEVIDLTQHMNFCRGNVVKYVARAAFKGAELEDLKKALFYLNKEIERISLQSE